MREIKLDDVFEKKHDKGWEDNMKIYSRDYSILTQEELKKWEVLKEKEIVSSLGDDLVIRKNLYREYPVAVRHFISLFPNNHLDIMDLQQATHLKVLTEEFYRIINNPSTTERFILNWISQTKAYFIIASIMKSSYSFGHHDAYIFPEFQLGNSYQVDYLLVGKNSGGYEFVFVELEHPNKNITLANGHLGDAIRKGERQVIDWKYWLEANYTTIYETFNKYKSPERNLPIEFMKYDSTRVHYAVVAGRRNDFNERTYQLKRQKKLENILLLHYDNLYDSAKAVIGELTY
ncbi:Shedu anti-phage system protein SduA domain-containing protein [Desulfofalx alkaliphila]|uniref:Shedu anti-phage system protein SduA domain-containing protein n=1 Tax=Desulfofalx alkaliphila TaxID=105483 RepID=UPI00068C2E39|nr:Shedu anti-phage system protein SduA domain-containing protein [Desulfofalx alkaliphila]